jgi:hypothetical protein
MFKLSRLMLPVVTCLLFSSIAGVGFVFHEDHVGFLSDHAPTFITILRDCYLNILPSGEHASILHFLNWSNFDKAPDGVTQYMCGWYSSAYDEGCFQVIN